MFSKKKKSTAIDTDQQELFEYAQKRIIQKKRLYQHFVVFLVGSIFLIIINKVLGVGSDFFIKDWFVWAILIWAFLFFIHLFNVYITHKFMGEDWEHRQLQKLKLKQEKRLAELQKQVEAENPVSEEKKSTDTTEIQ